MHYRVAMLNYIHLNENGVASKYVEATLGKVEAGVEIFNAAYTVCTPFIRKVCLCVGFNNK